MTPPAPTELLQSYRLAGEGAGNIHGVAWQWPTVLVAQVISRKGNGYISYRKPGLFRRHIDIGFDVAEQGADFGRLPRVTRKCAAREMNMHISPALYYVSEYVPHPVTSPTRARDRRRFAPFQTQLDFNGRSACIKKHSRNTGSADAGPSRIRLRAIAVHPVQDHDERGHNSDLWDVKKRGCRGLFSSPSSKSRADAPLSGAALNRTFCPIFVPYKR
jgi:hypothetical protein